ncbi:MAG: hypothetical protein O7A04_07605 [Acidobacteria bacterium]|nr:hypothetical protein [Acidobacteriota bacterium]
MATPLAPQQGSLTRAYLGATNLLAEELLSYGVTRRVEVLEAMSFNTAGMLRAPGNQSGSVRCATYLADEATIFNSPGSTSGFIIDPSASGNNTILATVPIVSVGSDIQVGQFRRYEIDDSGTDGLPAIGASLHDSIGSAISSAENSAENAMGAVVIGQQLLMRVVVVAFTGTNAIFQIEHDTTGFAGPTDAFSADLTMTGTGSDKLVTVATAAISDTFWRSAITGTFSNLEALITFGIT